MTFPPRVLILSGWSEGSGHEVVARALAQELTAHGCSVRHVDAYHFFSALTQRFLSGDVQHTLMEFFPALYDEVYRAGSQSPALAQLHRHLSFRARQTFEALLAEFRPSVVLTTNSVGCTLAAPLRAQNTFRLVVVTTDYYANAFQVDPAVDRYCVSHSWVARDFAAAGVEPDRVLVTGIPLREAFDTLPSSEEARRALSLPRNAPLILVTRGSMATGSETVDLLASLLNAPALAACQVVVILGVRERSARLVRENFAAEPRLRVVRFTDRMAQYLAAADILVGKAGGVTSTEVFTVGRPLVVFAPNAGIETNNVERFTGAGAARDAGRSPQAVVAHVTELVSRPDRRAAMVAAAGALVRPGSRQAVRAAVLSVVRESPLVSATG